MGLSCSPILGTRELAGVSDAVRPAPGRVLVRPGERRQTLGAGLWTKFAGLPDASPNLAPEPAALVAASQWRGPRIHIIPALAGSCAGAR